MTPEADFQTSIARLRWHLAADEVLRSGRRVADLLRVKYDPNQPRVPAGNPDGGQWTRVGGGDDPRVLSDASPENGWIPGVQYAQNRTPPRGRFPGATPAQEARLAVAEARAQQAIGKVREVKPGWRPTPSFSETIEGRIAGTEAQVREAEVMLREFRLNGAIPGAFAGESIPARGPGRDFSVRERREINMIGWETGCHTCGTTIPGTLRGNFVCDHQPPNALNFFGRPQRLFPHCAHCSLDQSTWITRNRR